MEYLNSNSQERELHQLQQMQHKAKESCMESFRLLHSHLKVLSINDLKRPGSKGGYERAFTSLFDQDINKLKAQLQDKNSTINNLKKEIKNVHEKSNEAKVKHDIDVMETINIKLESSVAKLLVENEKLNKENEHLKQSYKELYDSIKKKRIQTKDHNDSLIAQVNSKTVENADLKAQIQEKVFTNAALKNELRKLKGNSENTKFAKPSILGKPVLQPLRNQSVVRQPTAFRSERPKFLKQRFAPQVNVKDDLPKPVTPHYLPKVIESVFVKPHHVIASGSSRNSSNESYGSNDMAHKYYLEVAKKKTQDKNTNLKPSVMHTTSLQNTTNGSKPKPRSNNQTSKSLPVPKSSHGMLNGVTLVDTTERCSPIVTTKLTVNLQIVQMMILLTHMNAIKLLISVQITLSGPALKEKKFYTIQFALSQNKRNLLLEDCLFEGKLRQLPKGDYRDGLQIADMD
ncbi:hypothetical protein Tco_0483654 [Tanacetum coccineum]